MTVTAPQAAPLFIERAKTQTLTQPLHVDGAPVRPASGTVTIYDQDRTKIVDGATVTFDGVTPQYELAAATVPATLELSTDWQVEWALVHNGETHTIRRDAVLALRTLYPVVSHEHLVQRRSILGRTRPQGQVSWQPQVDEAWHDLVAMILGSGLWPHKLMSPWALRSTHMAMALALCFEELATFAQGGPGQYGSDADRYRGQAEAAWERLNVGKYDHGENNEPAAAEEGRHAEPELFLTAVPGWT